jgi:hypothetical protein
LTELGEPLAPESMAPPASSTASATPTRPTEENAARRDARESRFERTSAARRPRRALERESMEPNTPLGSLDDPAVVSV